MEHKIRVARRVIWIPNNDNVIALGVKADTIKVEFDSEWSYMDHIVVHFSNNFKMHRSILEGDTVTIPWELLLDSGILYVTFVGYIGLDVRLTTEQMSRPYFINPSGPALLESPLGSSPDDMQYFLSIADECAEAEKIRVKSEEQRRINELVRLSNEERRKKYDTAIQDKLEAISNAIQTLGQLHSDVSYLFLISMLHSNVEANSYDEETQLFTFTDATLEGDVLELAGEVVGCS